jgi:transcriptional regulator with XRE-family HTH domain
MASLLCTERRGQHGSEGSRLLFVAMTDHGITQRGLASRLSTTGSLVGRWLKGDQRPHARFRWALFELFAIHPTQWDKPSSAGEGAAA